MRNNEQFYADACGIVIDGDHGVRLHYQDDYSDLRDSDRSGYGPATYARLALMKLRSPSEASAGTGLLGLNERHLVFFSPAVQTRAAQYLQSFLSNANTLSRSELAPPSYGMPNVRACAISASMSSVGSERK